MLQHAYQALALALAIALALLGLAAPLAAQDQPDMATLPTLRAPGILTADAMKHQAAWLEVDQTGLYRLTLDGPGLLGLTGFRTANGRSDGSDPQQRLVEDGSAYRPGTLDDLLLEQGRAYFLQEAAAEPRAVRLDLIRPLDPATARSGDAMPGSTDTSPWVIGPGAETLLRPGDDRSLSLSSPTTEPLVLQAILPPGADATAYYRGVEVGPGGLFPLQPAASADLRVGGRERLGGSLPLMLLRFTALPDPDRYDEREPGATALGVIGPAGRAFRGALLARSDRDDVDFTLTRTVRFDLSLTVQDRGDARMRLLRLEDGAQLLFDAPAGAGAALRRALTLPPGDYRVEIAGERVAPSDYTLSFRPASDSYGAPQGEPDDKPFGARELRVGRALRGILAEDDPAYVGFTVPTLDHLWELRGVQGLTDLALTDGNDRDIGAWAARDGALVLRLVLPTGRFLAHLRGTGPYALRLTDLGPRPEGFEAEPNEADSAAQRLMPGQGYAGDFQSEGDVDLYEITLAAPTPLTLTVTAPDDGMMRTELDLDGLAALVTDVDPATGPVSYGALFPVGRHILRLQARGEAVSGRYALRLDRADLAEENEPTGSAALPGDGRIAGKVGGMDTSDRIFVALPQGSGAVALTCQGAPDWSVGTYGDGDILLRGRSGQVGMLDYAPDLGGAVELVVEGGPLHQAYACRAVFAPPVAVLPALVHDEAADEVAPFAVSPGLRVTGSFAEAGDGDRLTIIAPEGTLVGLRCDTAPEQTRPYGGDHVAQGLAATPLTDGTRVFVAEAAQAVELWPREAAFPQTWACDVLAGDSFATPAAMGPAAAFTGRGDTPPVLLPLGRPDWLTPVQISNDLDLGMTVAGLEMPFRAFARAGQRADIVLTLHNPGAAMVVALETGALADGWRLVPGRALVTVPAGGRTEVALTVEMPPMQSALGDPQIRVVAVAGTRRAAVTVPVALDAGAPERGAQPFWAVPAGLRGGLDPLRYQLGARLMTLDGAAVEAENWAFLHDGDAPHSAVPASFSAGVAEFRLAGVAPVAGFQVHLRTTDERGRWPDRLTLELSQDGQVWRAPMTVDLSASNLPQLFALPQVVTAGFARITRHGCRADPGCQALSLAEVGLVATPDWRPAGELDLADPALGGHVVTARQLGGKVANENPFGGRWNENFLTEQSGDHLTGAAEPVGDRIEVVVAFASNRAARIAALDWVGSDQDGERLAAVEVAFSLTGPAGPWTGGPALTAPAPGQTSARLTLPAAQWARAVRFILRRHPDQTRAIPDRIRVLEDPTAPSILGLWQDDSAQAGYEATVAPAVTALPSATGGPDAARAVSLTPGSPVASSVQLERNEDWWRIVVPDGAKQMLTLQFQNAALPEFVARLTTADGTALPLSRRTTPAGDLILTAAADPGSHLLRISEPPRSVAILWDTSDSVGPYIPRILDAVRIWATSLKPGRDRIQLLPFGSKEMLLKDWAGSADEVYPALSALPQSNSSDAETAMGIAATALAAVDGQRGIVIITDAETAQADTVWTPLLTARPRVVALSIDSSDPRGVAVLKDWTAINGGYFTRVTGSAGLADGLDLAAALFRAAKPYAMTATLTDLSEPAGAARLTLTTVKSKAAPQPTGGIEVILDASGSMLKRMGDGRRRIAVAHDALSGLVRNTLPKGTPFAFRAFGLAPDDCSSELKIPFGPLNPGAAEKAIRAVPAVNLAKTAIAASLAAAAEDLARTHAPRVMVLLTDGEETCGGDVAGTIAAIRAQGLDIRLSIVGFAVEDAGLAETFAAWAEQGGGSYVPAGDSAALAAGIRAATEARFAADRLYLDGRVETVATLTLQDSTTLPAGTYRLRPLQTAVGGALDITLTGGQALTLTYDPTTGLTEE